MNGKKLLMMSLLLSIFCAMPVYAAEKKVLLASSEYPPYFGEKLENYGFLTEIIVEAYKKVGYEVTIKFFPWARGIEETKAGRCDGMFALWHSPEREQWFVFSDPLPANELGFFKRSEQTIAFKTLADLKPYRIGIVKGYANPPEFEKAEYLKKDEVTNDDQNLQKLFKGYVDLILIDKILAQYIIQTKYPDQANLVEWLEPALQVVAQHLVLSKQAADYAQKIQDFNQGLQQITAEGMIQKIMAKHGF